MALPDLKNPDLSGFDDMDLIRELIARNGTAKAPWRVIRSSTFCETLISVGKDETANLVLHEDALKLLGF